MGGIIVIAATLVVGTLFHECSGLVEGLVVGTITFIIAYTMMNALPKRVAALQKKALQIQLDSIIESGATDKKVSEVEKKIEKIAQGIENTASLQDDGNKLVALMMAGAEFAWPPALMFILLGISVVSWMSFSE